MADKDAGALSADAGDSFADFSRLSPVSRQTFRAAASATRSAVQREPRNKKTPAGAGAFCFDWRGLALNAAAARAVAEKPVPDAAGGPDVLDHGYFLPFS